MYKVPFVNYPEHYRRIWDEAIAVAHTFVATVSAIVYCGAKQILVDIGEDMKMEVEQVEQVITPQTSFSFYPAQSRRDRNVA